LLVHAARLPTLIRQPSADTFSQREKEMETPFGIEPKSDGLQPSSIVVWLEVEILSLLEVILGGGDGTRTRMNRRCRFWETRFLRQVTNPLEILHLEPPASASGTPDGF
jgi:hypothetical protein